MGDELQGEGWAEVESGETGSEPSAEREMKSRPMTGPYSSPLAYLAYVAKEYQAVEALGDPDDPEVVAYLAKLARILDRAEANEKATGILLE